MINVSPPDLVLEKKGCALKLCPDPKPHTGCLGCPRSAGTETYPYHYITTDVPADTDLIIVAEAPTWSPKQKKPLVHASFSDDSGVIVRNVLQKLQSPNTEPALSKLKVATTYAVLCMGNQGDPEPSKIVLDRCKNVLLERLKQFETVEKKPILVLMGMTAIRALGIKAAKLKDVQSRLLSQREIGGQKFDVVVTISTKQLVAVPGLHQTFETDLRRGLQAAVLGKFEAQPTLEELTAGYIFPKTPDEVRDVCELILRYAEDNRDADDWDIAVDTETNTKFPHRETLKVLAVSFAWAKGKATAIPLWHPETPYDPELVVPYIKALLASKKRKVFHNAKFDLKVFDRKVWELNNFSWCTMLGEHVLEEDKKGQYGLKPLTRANFPEFAAYADVLQEALAKEEGDSQLENIRKSLKKTIDLAEAQVAAARATIVEAKDALKKIPKEGKKAKAQKDGGFEKIPLNDLLKYAAVDTDMTRRLYGLQSARLVHEQEKFKSRIARVVDQDLAAFEPQVLCDSVNPVRRLAIRTVFPVTPVIARMEYGGVRIDRPYLSELQDKLAVVITDAQAELGRMAGNDAIKLNSPSAIAGLLFETGFTHPTTGAHVDAYPLSADISKTKKGAVQTTEKIMQFLVVKYQCPFATKKLIYAKAFKAKNTFCQNVFDLSALDGKLHTNYNQHGTKTGRLSSNDENMQNIPKKLAKVNIKKVFIPDDDSFLFVNADAKGAEVRILTAYCHDQALIDSLNAGQDTHCFIASRIVALVRESGGSMEALASMSLDGSRALSYDDFANRDAIKDTDAVYGAMLDKFRTAVKRVVFGILYGAGPQKIAETIGISLEQAKSLIDSLFLMFPSIKVYMARTAWELETYGYVETFFGRRQRFAVKGAPSYLLGKAKRQTVNFKIQSTSSDIVMGRLAALEAPLKDLGGRLLLTVHDSIGFQIKKKYAEQLPDFIYQNLELGAKQAHPWLPVAFKWDYEVGPSYGELKSLNNYLANTLIKEHTTDAEDAFTEEEQEAILSET